MWRYINDAMIVRSSNEFTKEKHLLLRVVRDGRHTTCPHLSGDGRQRPSWPGQRLAGDDLGGQDDVEWSGIRLAPAERLDALYQHFDGPPTISSSGWRTVAMCTERAMKVWS